MIINFAIGSEKNKLKGTLPSPSVNKNLRLGSVNDLSQSATFLARIQCRVRIQCEENYTPRRKKHKPEQMF